MTRRTRTLLALATVPVAAALAFAAPANARLVNPVEATCWPGRIFVTMPAMEPVNSGWFVGPGGTITIDPPQWVRFRVHITRFNGTRWTIVASGSWLAREVNVAGGGGLDDRWLNLSTNQWGTGTTTFNVKPGNTFRIWAEYYWYGNQFYAPGQYSDYTPLHFDYRSGYFSEAKPYCVY